MRNDHRLRLMKTKTQESAAEWLAYVFCVLVILGWVAWECYMSVSPQPN
jgi:hypothetical protein